MGVGREGYLYKPAGENTGNGLVILPPNLSGQIRSVAIVDANGNVLDEGRYRHPYETGGSIFDFNYTGGTYGMDTKVQVTLDNGQKVYFGGGGGRNEGGVIGTEGGSGNYPQQQTAQVDAYGSPIASSPSSGGGNPLMQAATGLGGAYLVDQYGGKALDSLKGAISDIPGTLTQAVDYGKELIGMAPSAPIAAPIGGSALGAAIPELGGAAGASSLSSAIPAGAIGQGMDGSFIFGPAGETATAAAAPGAFASIAGPLTAAYGGYTLGQNLLDNKKDWKGGATSGAALGGGLALAGLTGGLSIPLSLLTGGALGGILGGVIGGGPNPRQIQRRGVRDKLRATPLANDQFKKHGLGFIGVGGKPIEIGDHEVDMKNPLAAQAIAYMDPIAEYMAGGDTSKREDVGAMFGNAILQNATTPGELRANALKLANQLGYRFDDIMNGLNTLKGQGVLDDDRYNIYLHNMGLLKEGSKPPADTVVPGIGGVPALPNGARPKDNNIMPNGANGGGLATPIRTSIPVNTKTPAQLLPRPQGNGSTVAGNMLNKIVPTIRGNGSSMVGNITNNRFNKK